LQVRAKTYDETKSSLKWADLIEKPSDVAAKIAGMDQVQTATPRLFASGFIALANESTGVRIIGIDPASDANNPYRKGMTSGQFLSADDREGILIGEPLATKMGLKTGDSLNLSVNTSNGDVAQQSFIVRGVYSTETFGFDSTTVFLSLAKAQAITQTENHASTIFILLKDKNQSIPVAAALQSSAYQVLTWQDMNELILQTESLSKSYMVILYLIVLFITATVITNTLIMAVFERTREIGILAAIGMKGWRIMAMFLAESSMLAVGGILMGLILGLLVVFYFSNNGFYIGNMGLSGMLIGNTIYANLTLADTVNLTITAFVITLLAGLYPAILAAGLEPVDALRGGK
jgi:ABC-type lipoprotein release transport system permease subunit